MQGQNGTQAMTNQPIVTKDVDNLTQAVTTIPGSGPTGASSFVWSVQALNREGKPVGGNNGTSEAFTFRR
ncbi:MAG: hypothetical protein PSV46_17775 [Reyranella sp.]|nr:hypothetical protein [Reyranella sp.]